MATGGIAPEGELSWSTISQRGVVVEKPQVGAGQATTRVFDEGTNPSKEEGLHLCIRDIMLRRPQKFCNAETMTIAIARKIITFWSVKVFSIGTIKKSGANQGHVSVILSELQDTWKTQETTHQPKYATLRISINY